MLCLTLKEVKTSTMKSVSCQENEGSQGSILKGDLENYLPPSQGRGPKIGEWLITQKWITPDQLSVALREQSHRPKRLGELMLDLGFISPNQLLTALSTLSGFPFVDLECQILDFPTVQLIPPDVARHYQLILFQKDQSSKGGRETIHFHLAMVDPEDLLALDKVRQLMVTQFSLEIEIIPYHATQHGIAHALDVYYPQSPVNTQEGAVIRLVNDLILEAVRLGASDIHLSPTLHHIDVHYRQDGLLSLAHTLHKERWSALSVRLKIMGSLDIAESRRPQNGRFSLILSGREVDFRLSCHPTIHGENFVLRILDKTQSLRTLDELGFCSEDVAVVKHLVRLPQGMIILSGPTGAGKTTTLYALLGHMDALSRNIMTLEEPVEYFLPNIRQTEIREGGPFRFDEGVRSLLRQDPDVIFISEIRDLETAQMALRAAMTGHLVLGTIHARDSFTLPQRFMDLGITPSVLSGNLLAGIAQRLVRRICEVCRTRKPIKDEERKRFFLPDTINAVYQGQGCDSCHHTGYKGREVVAEVVLFDEDLSVLMTKEETPLALRKAWRKKGCYALWDRGIQKVLDGKTTFAEIDRMIGIPV